MIIWDVKEFRRFQCVCVCARARASADETHLTTVRE